MGIETNRDVKSSDEWEACSLLYDGRNIGQEK